MSVDVFYGILLLYWTLPRLYSSSDSKKVSDSSQNLASTWQMQNYILPISSWKLVYSNETKQPDQELVQNIKKYVMCLS